MNLTNEDVQEILRLLDASSFDELQLTTDRFKLTLRRSPDGGWTQETATARAAQKVATIGADARAASLDTGGRSAPAGAAKSKASSSSHDNATHKTHDNSSHKTSLSPAAATSTGATPSTRAGLIDVNPPLIGTFYRAPKPGASPFVEVGTQVTKDTVVGIVETMKLMNSVYAGAAGEVTEICAENGQLVEQTHVLMRLRPLP
jgi:acetyl-CoA carboxylase biotin carboxyl carrier protein